MKLGDRLLQRWRIEKARPYIPCGSRVLDIGCYDGALFHHLAEHIREGIGIDPACPRVQTVGCGRLIPGTFPEALPDERAFDAITMLAVLEHIPTEQHGKLAADCERFLKPGGHLIITVPSPIVDHIVDVLKFLRVLDTISLEEHHGFRVEQITSIFAVGRLRLLKAQRFQLGLNNLFVFQREPETDVLV